jgi:hypothetical protein
MLVDSAQHRSRNERVCGSACIRLHAELAYVFRCYQFLAVPETRYCLAKHRDR